MALAPPNPIDVTFELVTPAYAGSADREKTDGLRPPTLKALLRFWWRTMHPEMSSQDLFDREADIFGATRYRRGGEEKGGQSLRVVPRSPWPQPHTDPVDTLEKAPMHVYMAYGPVAWDKHSTADPQRTRQGRKGAFVVGTERVRAQNYRPAFRLVTRSEEDRDELVNALWLLSAFSGFGSRSRRGWGSLRADTDWAGSSLRDPHSQPAETIPEGLQLILGPRGTITVNGNEPRHCAFSPNARVIIGREKGSAVEAQESAYKYYHGYRKSLGKDIRTGRGGNDYNTRRAWLTHPPMGGASPPEGSSFGLPHNAQFDPPNGPRVDVGVGRDLSGRRASSLFFTVVGSSSSFWPLALWLPSLFLPADHDIFVAISGKGATRLQHSGNGGVERFLDGLGTYGWTEVTW